MSSTPLQVAVARLRVPVTDTDHIRGAIDAPVTVVEYGDYQCPHCGAAHQNLRELLRQRAETVRLVYRHFPIANVHPHSEHAAEMAEAAGSQGRFWELHDWIYEHQDQLDPVHLELGVQQVELPADELTAEVGQRRYAERVQGDFVGGIRSGVNGTPTFFINEVRHDGPYGLPDLLTAVDAAANS